MLSCECLFGCLFNDLLACIAGRHPTTQVTGKGTGKGKGNSKKNMASATTTLSKAEPGEAMVKGQGAKRVEDGEKKLQQKCSAQPAAAGSETSDSDSEFKSREKRDNSDQDAAGEESPLDDSDTDSTGGDSKVKAQNRRDTSEEDSSGTDRDLNPSKRARCAAHSGSSQEPLQI